MLALRGELAVPAGAARFRLREGFGPVGVAIVRDALVRPALRRTGARLLVTNLGMGTV